MEKPQFDPNQPFQPMADQEKPAFDPSQPFQTTHLTEEQKANLANAKEDALQQKYGGTEGVLKSFAEGAGRGSTFGASTLAERAAGVNPEDIRGREEANPIASTLGEISGLVGSAFTGIGEGAAVEKVGELVGKGVSKALNEGVASKVGSMAAKMAVENALVQSGNEVHRMFAQDPAQSAGTAMADIGLAALLGAGGGAAFGVVSPLWKATVGKSLGHDAELIKNRINGNAIGVSPEIEDAISASGIELAPEIRSGISHNPSLVEKFNTLREATTQPGMDLQQSLRGFQQTAADEILNAFGKTEKDIPEAISHFEAGKGLVDDIADSIKTRIEPIAEKYNKIAEEFKKIPLTSQDSIADKLGQLSADEGWNIQGLPQNELVQKVIKALPDIKTVENLRKFESNFGANVDWTNGQMANAAGKIKSVLNAVKEQAVERAAGAESAQKLMDVQLTNQAYRAEKQFIDSLNDRLHVGKFSGPEGFVKALKDMKPENVISRLSNKNDVGLTDLLLKELPGVSDKVKDYQINKILSAAAAKAPEGMPIKPGKVFEAINKMSPEMQEFLLSGASGDKLRGIKTLLDAVPEYRSSMTAKNAERLLNHPEGALGALSWITGHGFGKGMLAGTLGKWLLRDGPDALRLMYLRFLGSSGAIEPAGMKALAGYASALFKGESALNKGIGSIFKSTAQVYPMRQLFSNSKDRERLDKKIDEFAKNPEQLMNIGGSLQAYASDHSSQMTATATRAITYLSKIKPKTSQPGILDKPIEPSQAQKAKYDRALTIADKPLSILEDVKKGTVTPDDMITLRSIYPDLYNRMSEKMMDQLAEIKQNGGSIPYHTKIGLSMFLGQALDATMTPQSIAMNQPQQTPAEMPQGNQPKGPGPHSFKTLGKLPTSYMTPDQTRSAKRAGMS